MQQQILFKLHWTFNETDSTRSFFVCVIFVKVMSPQLFGIYEMYKSWKAKKNKLY